MHPDPRDPSFLGALIYFHQAAETLSFSGAAKALNVTPSAVSHRIAALEAALGKKLFERRVREVRLTQDGVVLASSTARIWDELQSMTKQLDRQEVLRVSVGPYLSSQWLLPRIGAFEAMHPKLRVDLIHLIGQPDPSLADVSIVWSDLESLGKNDRLLFGTNAVPVAAPGPHLDSAFWNGILPPIHYRDRSAWRHWLSAVGAPLGFAERGEVMEDPHLVLEAAAYGRGIAIGFLPFIGRYFEQGRLVPVSRQTVDSDRGYKLVLNRSERSTCHVFAEWLLEQSSQSSPSSAGEHW